jgi:hypothetical protein
MYVDAFIGTHIDICLCVCTHAYIYVYAYTHTCIIASACTSMRTHRRTHAHRCAYTDALMHTHTPLCQVRFQDSRASLFVRERDVYPPVCVCVCVCMCVYVYVCVFVCVYVYVCVFVCVCVEGFMNVTTCAKNTHVHNACIHTAQGIYIYCKIPHKHTRTSRVV